MIRYSFAALLAVGAVVAWPDLAATHLPWAAILLVLIALDFVVALAEVTRPGQKGIAPDRLWATARKTLAYYATILVLYLMGAYNDQAWGLIPGVYMFWSAVEGLSILGHCAALGAAIPAFVREWFESIRQGMEAGGR